MKHLETGALLAPDLSSADGLPYEWRLNWRTAGETNRIRAFAAAARDFAAANGNPLLPAEE